MQKESCKWTATGDIECVNQQGNKEANNVVFKSVLVNHPMQEMDLKKQVEYVQENFEDNKLFKDFKEKLNKYYK